MDNTYLKQGDSASLYLIGVNDESGALAGSKSPPMPYINRRICGNEFSREAKKCFINACSRVNLRVFDVKPEENDVLIDERRRRIEGANPSLLITFSYGKYKNKFNGENGAEVFYSGLNPHAEKSRLLAEYIYYQIITGTKQNGRGVNTLDVMVTATAQMPCCIVEAGYMTNLGEAKFMIDPDYQKAVGEYSCAGVCNYLGVPFEAPAPVSRDMLKIGSSGEGVVYLQQKLNAKLYDTKGVDGIFGINTQNAVKEFQSENGLEQTGTVDLKTWAKLMPIGGGRG